MTDHVSIITANFNPLRFVVRDEKDLWEPTLEQINGRSYDYVKLHRLSEYFDVEIAPYSLGICFDGTLVLPAIKKFHERNAALTQFNRFLSELLIGGIYCEAVSPDDVDYGELTLTGYAKIHGHAKGPLVTLHKAARSTHIGTLDVIRLLKPETVTIKELHEALSKGRDLIAKLGDIPREQILYGTTFYVRSQWAESLIHTWTLVERVVEIAWQKQVVKIDNSQIKQRREFLEDHRTWPVSTKLEVLFQKELLPFDSYEKLTTARKSRNDFAHRGISPTEDSATKALQGLFEIASLSASNFISDDLFEGVLDAVVARCKTNIFPKERAIERDKVSHWLEIPPLPGDKQWGDREYEIIEDLRLKPLEPP